ncbi:MAG: hypothetical protein BAJALOKI2v1_190014 [Promethearchaeota archaeon]|jgi:DNA-binding Lrp family transcriptional regulator|nr:MAG: hypothetical protein BAJALOKI2v1_190014 [Candidatus Lokiarchaeota archaeon]
MPLKAIILGKLGINVISRVIEQLKEIPEIKQIVSLTGIYDIMCEVQVEEPEELYEVFSRKIDPIEGLIETNTHVIMKSWER